MGRLVLDLIGEAYEAYGVVRFWPEQFQQAGVGEDAARAALTELADQQLLRRRLQVFAEDGHTLWTGAPEAVPDESYFREHHRLGDDERLYEQRYHELTPQFQAVYALGKAQRPARAG